MYQKFYRPQQKKYWVNNQIRAREVRLIDEKGENKGVVPIEEALAAARMVGFDLIEITSKVIPPVCKIMDYGKFKYAEEKAERKQRSKQKGDEVKSIRIGFMFGAHDLEIRAAKIDEFLKEDYKIKIEMPLKGRQKKFGDLAAQKFEEFLKKIKTPYKIVQFPKRTPQGFIAMIVK